MRIRWTAEQVEIEGTAAELRRVSASLKAVGSGQQEESAFPALADGSVAPYEEFLFGLDVRLASDRLMVTVTPDRRLRLLGGEAALHAAATYFDVPDLAAAGAHSHLEWYEGHPTISREALPVVVSVEPETSHAEDGSS
jgi:hypothetical protein